MLSLPLALSSGPQTSTRGLKTRSQPSLDAKERFCKNACFPEENKGFLRVGWPRTSPFFALRPPPRAIWTGISSRNPWETPLRTPRTSKGILRNHSLGSFWSHFAPAICVGFFGSATHRWRNLMIVSRILLLTFFVLARLSFCSFWFVFRIRRMSEGFCFLLVEIANRLQRFCSCGGPFLCLFS